MSNLLLKLETFQESDAALSLIGEHMHMLVSDFHKIVSSAFTINPSLNWHILTHRMDTPEAGVSTPDPRLWDRVASEMRPSPQQLAELSACWMLKETAFLVGLPHCCDLEL